MYVYTLEEELRTQSLLHLCLTLNTLSKQHHTCAPKKASKATNKELKVVPSITNTLYGEKENKWR